MSNLIKSHKAVTTAPRLIPPAPPSAATAPAEMDHRPVDPVGPEVSQAPASSTSSLALLVKARCGHRHPRTPDTPSASTADASGSQQRHKMGGGCHRFLMDCLEHFSVVFFSCLFISQEKHPRTLSLVEDGEYHPGDQRTYHDWI